MTGRRQSALATQVLKLYSAFRDLSEKAKSLEDEILSAVKLGPVSDRLYESYEKALKAAEEAHERYASARQELRTARSRGHSNRMGCV